MKDFYCNIYINCIADANAFDEFNCLYNIMSSNSSVDLPTVNVELLEKCINRLKLCKAAGADQLIAEHIVHAAPSLIIHPKLFFSLFLSHSFVPDAFSTGTIIPVIKDKSGDPGPLGNYRPITLSPVVSKLFENVLLELYGEHLISSYLHFKWCSSKWCVITFTF